MSWRWAAGGTPWHAATVAADRTALAAPSPYTSAAVATIRTPRELPACSSSCHHPSTDRRHSKKRSLKAGLGLWGGGNPHHRPSPKTSLLLTAAAVLLTVATLASACWRYQHGGEHHQDIAAQLAPVVAAWSSVEALPDAPDECPQSLRSRIAWGVGTSAYQVEGAADADGRTASIWDTFSNSSGKVAGNATGATAAGHYQHFKQDVQLMAALGIKHYRLSLSWSRLLPAGGRGSAPNAAALRFYKELLQQLHAAGITPVVTLYHFDLPQVLQDAYGGFLDQQLGEDFLYYADIVFEHLGPFVKHWLTFSEPMSICHLGYGVGAYAPGVAKGVQGQYRCGHTLLLAHAKAVQLYRLKYQPQQGGRVSMAVSGHWGLPKDPHSSADVNATDVYVQFQVGWLADPLFFGDYPAVMRASQKHLPKFKDAEKKLLAGSVDFLALNYYTSHFVAAAPPGAPKTQLYEESLQDAAGNYPGPATGVFWQFQAPAGLQLMLSWVSQRYQRPEVWVTENGVALPGEHNMTLQDALNDAPRVDFFRQHLDSVCKAVLSDRVNLAAYFAWSFLDAFEWADGFSAPFGIVHANRTSEGLQRRPKLSAQWLSQHFFRPAADSIACLEIRSCGAATSRPPKVA